MLREEKIRHILDEAIAASGVAPPRDAERRALSTFVREVGLWGEKIHLVGRGSLDRNLGIQLLDSLLLLAAAESGCPSVFARPAPRLADIGSGAGFPGMVWKILRPRMRVVLFERRLKPYSFLERIVALLELDGAAASDMDAAQAEPRIFDIVTAKAAGRLAEILPMAERLLVEGGIFVTIKGGAWKAELRRAAARTLKHTGAIELSHKRGHALIFIKTA